MTLAWESEQPDELRDVNQYKASLNDKTDHTNMSQHCKNKTGELMRDARSIEVYAFSALESKKVDNIGVLRTMMAEKDADVP